MCIFLSLNWKDRHYARMLISILDEWGFDDVCSMLNTPGGIDWEIYMLEAIRGASVCLLSASKSGVTYTQGYETAVADARGLSVIPVLHSGGSMSMLPSLLIGLQCREISSFDRDICILKSRIIHDIQPFFIAPAARQTVIDLVGLIATAQNHRSHPLPIHPIDDATAETVAKATKRQQLAGMRHLLKHRDGVQYLCSFRNQLDERYQMRFNKLVNELKEHDISDQEILRICVLADQEALTAWKGVWNIRCHHQKM